MTESFSDIKCPILSKFVAFADFVEQKGFPDAELATHLKV